MKATLNPNWVFIQYLKGKDPISSMTMQFAFI